MRIPAFEKIITIPGKINETKQENIVNSLEKVATQILLPFMSIRGISSVENLNEPIDNKAESVQIA